MGHKILNSKFFFIIACTSCLGWLLTSLDQTTQKLLSSLKEEYRFLLSIDPALFISKRVCIDNKSEVDSWQME